MSRNKVTSVINKRHQRYFDVYAGRGSLYGNPFEIGKDGTREEVIEKYKILFEKKIKKERFRKAVLKLRGKILACYCRPKEGFQGRLLCHVQYIWSYLEGKPPEECP